MSPETAMSRVIALVTGGALDEPMIEMACMLARRNGGQLFLVATTVVERAHRLDDPLTEESRQAHLALERARASAERMGCQAETRELRTRDAAMALVDEAADLGCDHIVVGFSGEPRGAAWTLVEHVLKNAPCSVWVHRSRK